MGLIAKSSDAEVDSDADDTDYGTDEDNEDEMYIDAYGFADEEQENDHDTGKTDI